MLSTTPVLWEQARPVRPRREDVGTSLALKPPERRHRRNRSDRVLGLVADPGVVVAHCDAQSRRAARCCADAAVAEVRTEEVRVARHIQPDPRVTPAPTQLYGPPALAHRRVQHAFKPE